VPLRQASKKAADMRTYSLATYSLATYSLATCTLATDFLRRAPAAVLRRHAGGGPLAVLALAIGLFAGAAVDAPAADAQADPSMQSIVAKLNRLEADLNSLQRNFYRSSPTGEAPAAQSGSPAGATGSVDAGDQFFAFEQSLRRLTAQVEQNGHRLQQLERQVTRLNEDVEFRLQEIEGKLGMSALGDSGGAAADRTAAAARPMDQAARDTSSVPTARPSSTDPDAPQQLGTLRADPATAAPRDPAGTGATRPGSATAALTAVPGDAYSGSPRERYNASLQLIRVGQLSEAESALQAFLRDHPEDPLASNAQYWLGETYYARNEYEQAAAAFLAGYRNHPENSKAPDNLLKLGISLAAMGQQAESCPVFDTLLSDYPNAPGMVRDRARDERRRAGC